VGGHLAHLAHEPYAVAFPFGCLGGFTLVQALVLLRGWLVLTGINEPPRRVRRVLMLRYTWIGGFLGLIAVVLATAVPPWATAIIAGVGGPAALAAWNPGLIAGRHGGSGHAAVPVPVPADPGRDRAEPGHSGSGNASPGERGQSPGGGG
jgi:hypothetical protein